jgi:hypothetical protein
MIGQRPAEGRIRLAWYRPAKENWFELAPVVLHRLAYGNAPWFGGWVLGFVGVLLVAAGALGVSAVLREARE